MIFGINITDRWIFTRRARDLHIDLGRLSLNGVVLGESISGLRSLGPSDFRANRQSSYTYKRYGLTVVPKNTRLAGFLVNLSRRTKKMQRFPIRWSVQGRESPPLDAQLTESASIELLGDYIKNWDDGTDRSITWRRPTGDIEIVWASNGSVQYIDFDVLDCRKL